MALTPKRIAKIIAWVNLPLVLMIFFGGFYLLMQGNSGDILIELLTLSEVIIGIFYFILAYKQRLSKTQSNWFWIAAILINLLFIIYNLFPLGLDLANPIFFLFVLYPVIILLLSIKALIKTNQNIA